mmetsp:Transcript_309/g.833  ORF Transcript_309/g.833 Transcript_309/m.833 type:complete len:179 (-) Transcript_309:70-606(-)
MGGPAKPEHRLYEVSGGKAGEEPGPGSMEEDERKRWTDEFELHDRDKDGKLSWDDWVLMVYHENPQRPRYYDGYDDHPDYPVMDQEKLEEQFRAHDTDKDEHLSFTEMLSFVRDAHGEDVGGILKDVEPEKRAEQREIMLQEYEEEASSYAASLMEELDQNEDGKLSIHEWQMYYMDY